MKNMWWPVQCNMNFDYDSIKLDNFNLNNYFKIINLKRNNNNNMSHAIC